MKIKLDQELEELNQEMISLGILCEKAISISTNVLRQNILTDGASKEANITDDEISDLDIRIEISDLDIRIERKERAIEGKCIKLLMQHQPVARDLRLISSALKMVTDMKRIGIQAGNIAEIIDNNPGREVGIEDCISNMADATRKMVTESIDAFVKKDAAIAREVIQKDDEIDNYFVGIKNKIVECLREGSADGEHAIDMLMVSKYLERIGDHAENIAGWVLYSIEGTVR